MKQFQMQLMPPFVHGENLIDRFIEEFKENQEEELTEKIISILETKGYKVTPPPKQVKDEYTFERAWNLYEKKVGCKAKLEKKWNSMSLKDRKAAIKYIPLYVLSQPDKQYRKNFQTFLNQRGWEDELIGATPPPAAINEKPSEMSQLIARTKAELQNLTEEAQDNKLRKRICGMIEVLKNDPQSLCRIPLEIYRDNGTMERLGIQWNP
jgi:hypothetical protein